MMREPNTTWVLRPSTAAPRARIRQLQARRRAQFADLGADFTIPWTEVIGFAAIAFVFSLVMTWWPSRGAANVPVANALRYE